MAFAAQAVESGAAGILTDPEGRERARASGLPVLVVADPRSRLGVAAAWTYGHPADGMLLIGTTGTSGKTTITYLLESGLRAAGMVTGLIGTVETQIAGSTISTPLTTPEATDLHAMFALAREQSVSAAAMEVSSHALTMGRVGGVVYDVAVFTNLSQDHLDFHADLRDYFEAKAKLFRPDKTRVAVVNADDPFGRALIDMVTAEGKVPVTTVSTRGEPTADWRAEDIELGSTSSAFRVVGPGGVAAHGAVALPGPFNVDNALAAIVALVEAGVSLDDAAAGVAACPGVPGRMERVGDGSHLTALVDYSHKPGAIEAVLRSLRTVTDGELTIVFGCGGDRDRGKRPLMGETAARLADAVILTDDNPRGEDPLGILSGILDGVSEVPHVRRARVTVEPDRVEAIALAVRRGRPGDTIVVAGKGHERGQTVAGVTLPFDDREVLRQALRDAAGRHALG